MRIVADLHTHSLASTHAFSSIREMINAARGQGLAALCITDHGPQIEDAPHRWHFSTMRHSLPESVDGLTLWCGCEVNLLPGGGLDLHDDILAGLDFVVCSQHFGTYSPTRDRKRNTDDWLAACHSKHVDCLGHIGQTDYDFDHEAVVRACVQTNTLIEVNNASFGWRESEENFRSWLGWCRKLDCRVVVNSDAHSEFSVGRFDSALALLAELDFPQQLVLNSDEAALRAWLAAR